MNKSDLIDLVAENAGCSKADAERYVNSVFQGVRAGLLKDQSVQIMGFGSFSVRERKARQGRNPATGEVLNIPASRTVVFRPGKALKENL
ncbi:MAG: HU family DNA-binding protein [Planctomycetota bacterium]